MAGCDGIQVANYLGIHPDTLYRRVKQDHKIGCADYFASKRTKGEAAFLSAQYAKAIGATKKGDTQLLIWLGKCRYKQRETDAGTEPVNDKLISELITELKGTKLGTKQQTNTVLPTSEQAIQHLGGGGSIGEDIQLDHQAD